MTDEAGPNQGRHAAPTVGPAQNGSTQVDDAVFARPADASGGFAKRDAPPSYAPPPRTVPPAEQAAYGRPAGAASFAPAPGERITPRATQPEAVAPDVAAAYAAPSYAQGGFAPAPGSRIGPNGAPPESPWWKPDALRDPWRDPSSPFWLGGGAIFRGSRAEQRDPAYDVLTDPDALPGETAGAGLDEDLDTGTSKDTDNVRRGRFGLPTLVLTLVIAILAGVVGGGAGWLLTRSADNVLHRPDVSIAQAHPAHDRARGSVAGIARRVGPAVVSIAVQSADELAIGSGVVIDNQGDVLTNNHVISDAVGDSHAQIVVTFSDEATARARIVGHDPTSDLAVIKVPDSKLTVARLGDSANVQVGDPVVAIGSPLGLQGTVTSGIVSALNRPVHAYNDTGTSDAYLDAIQTDAAINPGNSGGALVDSTGAVIGINSAAAVGTGQTAANGIGYAIPINYARRIALSLIHTGKARHASLGAHGKTRLSGLLSGAYIEQISPGGPAAKAGLKVGDTIVAAGGQVTQSFDQLIVIVQSHEPGDRIQVTYYPRGQSTKRTTTVTLD